MADMAINWKLVEVLSWSVSYHEISLENQKKK